MNLGWFSAGAEPALGLLWRLEFPVELEHHPAKQANKAFVCACADFFRQGGRRILESLITKLIPTNNLAKSVNERGSPHQVYAITEPDSDRLTYGATLKNEWNRSRGGRKFADICSKEFKENFATLGNHSGSARTE